MTPDLFSYAKSRRDTGMALAVNAIKAKLSYNPETGEFSRLVRCGKYTGGTLAGSLNKSKGQGYIIISINGKMYRAHRLAWLFVYGTLPPKGFEIDHINGNRADNRLANLRLATRSQNNANGRRRVDNKSGLRGVSPFRGTRWRVTINNRHVGVFKTKEAAAAAYADCAREAHGEFWLPSAIEKLAQKQPTLRASDHPHVAPDAWALAAQLGIIQQCKIEGVYFSRIYDPRSA